MMVEWQLTLWNTSNIFSFTSSSLSHPILSYLFWTVLSKKRKSHQSQELALQSSFPKRVIVLSVMTTSLPTKKWRTDSRRISWYHSTWICLPVLFLLPRVLCFMPMFYITFFLFPDIYFPDILLSSYSHENGEDWFQEFIPPAVTSQLQFQLSPLDITSNYKVVTKATLIQLSGNDKNKCRKLVRKGTLKV